MERQLSKEDALILMSSHWQVLADHPEISKEEAVAGQDLVNDCYACEFNEQQGDDMYCGSSCIVDWGYEEEGCMHVDSDFKIYEGASSITLRTRAAQRIVAQCEEAISNLN